MVIEEFQPMCMFLSVRIRSAIRKMATVPCFYPYTLYGCEYGYYTVTVTKIGHFSMTETENSHHCSRLLSDAKKYGQSATKGIARARLQQENVRQWHSVRALVKTGVVREERVEASAQLLVACWWSAQSCVLAYLFATPVCESDVFFKCFEQSQAAVKARESLNWRKNC